MPFQNENQRRAVMALLQQQAAGRSAGHKLKGYSRMQRRDADARRWTSDDSFLTEGEKNYQKAYRDKRSAKKKYKKLKKAKNFKKRRPEIYKRVKGGMKKRKKELSKRSKRLEKRYGNSYGAKAWRWKELGLTGGPTVEY